MGTTVQLAQQPALRLQGLRNPLPRILIVRPPGTARETRLSPAPLVFSGPERACETARALVPDLVVFDALDPADVLSLTARLRRHPGTRSAALATDSCYPSPVAPLRPGLVPSPETRPRVLVIDDDLPFARALADTISEEGWSADALADAREAMARVQAGGLAGVFVDYVMPGTSGAAIVQEFLRFHPDRSVVLMSGYDLPAGVIAGALQRGRVLFLEKPMRREEIHLALEMFRGFLPGGPNGAARQPRPPRERKGGQRS